MSLFISRNENLAIPSDCPKAFTKLLLKTIKRSASLFCDKCVSKESKLFFFRFILFRSLYVTEDQGISIVMSLRFGTFNLLTLIHF